MRHWQHAVILAGALLLAAPAAAQPPDLIGTWKGTGFAVRLGPSHYRTTKDVEAAFPDKAVEFTYVIKEQHGHRFAGEMTSERGKRTFIGAMQQDNRGGIILDNDGQYIFTLIDPNTIDMCYSCQYPDNKRVACFRLKHPRRQATK
jgi:hypothetical protein